MLETWNLVRKYNTYVALENILFSTKILLILLIAAFFFIFVLENVFGKIVSLLKTIVWELC